MISLFVLYPGQAYPQFTFMFETELQKFAPLVKDTIYFFVSEEKTVAFI